MKNRLFNADTLEFESSGLEELPDVYIFGPCSECGNQWRQTYIEGVTDV